MVEYNPINTEYNALKMLVLQQAIEQNQKKLDKITQDKVIQKEKNNESLLLLNIRKNALKRNEHPYDSLKKKGYILDPVIEFY